MTALILASALAMFAVAFLVTRAIERVLIARLELWTTTCDDEPDVIAVDDRDIIFAMPATRPLRALAA